jgi:hypothetical protein
MNFNKRWFQNWCPAGLSLLPAILIGCNSNPGEDPALKAQNQEMEQLRQENQSLAQVKAYHEEVERLRKENQDLPKLRSQYQEVGRFQKENEQLRQQIQKISPSAATQKVAAVTGTSGSVHEQAQEPDKEKAGEEFALNDGDDVMVDPKQLKQLLPDFDWEKLGRKEPLGIRALIEKDGIQLTNALQLQEYGITNFVIQRAAPSTLVPAPNQPPAK